MVATAKKLLAGLAIAVVLAIGSVTPAEEASADAGWLDYHDWIILEFCSGTCEEPGNTEECCSTPS